jgi:hypothetical protein
MAWAFVQSTGAFTTAAGTTRALAYTGNTVAGNRLIAGCIWTGSGTATCALTDSQGNTWTPIANTLGTSSTNRVQIFHAPAGSSAANTVTMTTSVSTAERVMMIGEFSGLSGSLGAAPINSSGSSANPSSNITVDSATSLLVGAMFSGGSATQGTGWTLFTATQDGNAAEYRLPAGTGAQAVSWTMTSTTWTMGAAEFLASAAASSTVTPVRRSFVPVSRAANY